MNRTFLAVIAVAVALSGCKAKEVIGKAAIEKDLEKRGTIDLMKQTAEDEYTPPEDGRLTEAQIQMYLKVREHEKKIAQVAKEQMKQHSEKAEASGEKSMGGLMEGLKALGSAADLVTADIRAAKDLGYNTQEYLWVKGQILAASGAAIAEKATEAMTAGMDASYQQMKKAHDEATDPATKKMYADMLAGYEKSKAEMAQQQEQQDPAIAYNRRLLAKYENELKAWAAEWSKYEDKPGEADKAVADFQKSVEKSKTNP
ncbi:MAG TPA: hypothetical protein VNL91_01035 [Thermoanaerobaculia bacterium]|nr:hypothetical protein [Thermoanaerobaculia bacterium]